MSFISLAHSYSAAILLLLLPFIPCPQFRASSSFLSLAVCRLYASLLIIRFILWSDLVPDRRILLLCSRYFLKFWFLFRVVLFRRNVKTRVWTREPCTVKCFVEDGVNVRVFPWWRTAGVRGLSRGRSSDSSLDLYPVSFWSSCSPLRARRKYNVYTFLFILF